MPKILIGVSSSYCASFLKGQVQFWVDHGYTVVIMSGPGEEISMLAETEQAKLVTIPFTKRITPFKDLGQLIKIVRILRKEKPDIINAGNPKSGFLIMLAAWLTRHKKRVFTLHGLLSDTKRGFARSIIGFTEKMSCSIAHKVIVVSPSLKEHAEKRGILKAGKGVVIEKGSCNGIDLEAFSRNESSIVAGQALKRKLGIDTNSIIIGFVGRVSKDKGIDGLIKSFTVLQERYPFLKLLIAGPLLEEHGLPPSVLAPLKENKNIHYLGLVADVVPVYAATDIFVLPSLREGFGNVLIEAAAMQVPVVAPDIPGCRDAVSNGFNGFLFEKANTASLTDSIEYFIDHSALREQYGANGRRFVEDNFSNVRVWNGLLHFYRSTLAT
ncbi:MAG: glycosyltransferase family 4 protein [Agriterribacter sp.]